MSNPISAKPLTFNLADGKWVPTLDSGEELSEEELEKTESIVRQLSGEEEIGLHGAEPRKIGDEWDVDPRDIPGFGDEANLGGSFKLKFDRVEEYAGQKCAVLTGRMEVSGSPEEGDGKELTISLTASVTQYRSLEHLEDLKLVIEGEMAMTGAPQPGMSLTVRGPLKMTSTTTLTLP